MGLNSIKDRVKTMRERGCDGWALVFHSENGGIHGFSLGVPDSNAFSGVFKQSCLAIQQMPQSELQELVDASLSLLVGTVASNNIDYKRVVSSAWFFLAYIFEKTEAPKQGKAHILTEEQVVFLDVLPVCDDAVH